MPFSLYEFLRMPLGLKNAAQISQQLMDTVCHGLDAVFVYMDDILVASPEEAPHKLNLRQLFERLRDHGLVINVAKCQSGRPPLISSVIESHVMVPRRCQRRSKLSLLSGDRTPSRACMSL